MKRWKILYKTAIFWQETSKKHKKFFQSVFTVPQKYDNIKKNPTRFLGIVPDFFCNTPPMLFYSPSEEKGQSDERRRGFERTGTGKN